MKKLYCSKISGDILHWFSITCNIINTDSVKIQLNLFSILGAVQNKHWQKDWTKRNSEEWTFFLNVSNKFGVSQYINVSIHFLKCLIWSMYIPSGASFIKRTYIRTHINVCNTKYDHSHTKYGSSQFWLVRKCMHSSDNAYAQNLVVEQWTTLKLIFHCLSFTPKQRMVAVLFQFFEARWLQWNCSSKPLWPGSIT